MVTKSDLDPLCNETKRVVEMIQNVYDHNVEGLEQEIGNFILSDLVRFAEELVPLPPRDQRAAIYVLLSSVRAALIDINVACEYLAAQDPPKPPAGASV